MDSHFNELFANIFGIALILTIAAFAFLSMVLIETFNEMHKRYDDPKLEDYEREGIENFLGFYGKWSLVAIGAVSIIFILVGIAQLVVMGFFMEPPDGMSPLLALIFWRSLFGVAMPLAVVVMTYLLVWNPLWQSYKKQKALIYRIPSWLRNVPGGKKN